MALFTGLLLPAFLCAIAVFIARRERRLYRHSKDAGWDLFLYSKGRLWRRMAGVGVLLATAGTLAAVELFPATTSAGASAYLVLLLVEVLALLILPLIDLWETARTAKPEDLTRQGDRERQTRGPESGRGQ